MEAELGGESRRHPYLYGPVVSDLRPVGKKTSLDWDLNDWRWDGDLLRAAPIGPVAADCGACSSYPSERSERDLEKRRRVGASAEEGEDEEDECLRLGGQAYPISGSEKKSKVAVNGAVGGCSSNSGRAVCQVEDCRADLSGSKDYHKRHKVCDMHSKASEALVGNVMQRFCQQCSRFHVLEEFDEGKRSCRRRLFGHNRRRRKTHPDTVVNDDKGSNYLLISLLRILSNMHSNNNYQTSDPDLLSHLLKNLASVSGSSDERTITSLLQGYQASRNAGTSAQPSQNQLDLVSDDSGLRRPLDTNCRANQTVSVPGTGNPLGARDGLQSKSLVEESRVGRIKYNNIDLNSVYDDSLDNVEDPGSSHLSGTSDAVSLDYPVLAQCDSQKPTPPQLSRNSDSTCTRSPSTSSGEAQSRTDRIVFKLFGKNPSDLPFNLRSQIFNWLSNSPTDMESYIRPGCIILTIYLHLEKSTWEEICSDLGSSLKKLLDSSNDTFWNTGWLYSRVQNYVAFTYNGHLILDTSLHLKNSTNCIISSIKPIAVSLSEKTQFEVKGFNLVGPSTRLLCALDGKYLVQENCYELTDATETTNEHDEIESLNFSCSVPSVSGRGFIEVEDHGLSSSFFPFIVAEQDVCSEIRTLESSIDVTESANCVERQPDLVKAKNQALDFIHEMGWLLHRSHVKSRLGHMDPNSVLFPFRRFRWLMEFSMDRDWCFVVNKLLSILFEGSVDSGEFSSVEVAVLNMGLLHSAVRRNCRPMVELLLKFVPRNAVDENQNKGSRGFLFKPDLAGPKGLTPLHVAACQVGYEAVLDALTDDPGKVGVEAWKNAKDETGLTPNDYACRQGHVSYIYLVQRKTTVKGSLESGHVVVNIPNQLPDGLKPSKVVSLEIDNFVTKAHLQRRCGACQHRKAGFGQRSALVYRPAMFSLVAVAAVCVCVALLFKSCPEVLYVFQPFTWERLKYGSI